jgi:chondroitin 4-sulfotransferase 11
MLPKYQALNAIFIHIPKTGGQSIEAALQPWMTSGKKKLPRHPTARRVRRSLNVPGEWEKAFKFTVVRNPWSRLVSFYFYGQAVLHPVDMSFHEWVQWVCSDETGLPLQGKGAARESSHRSWLRSRTLMVEYLDEDIDFIARQETLNRDWGVICRRLGIEAPLGRKNVSRHPPVIGLYTPELADLVGEHFQKDLDRFGYAFPKGSVTQSRTPRPG